MLIGKWDLRLEEGAVQPDCLCDRDKEFGGGKWSQGPLRPKERVGFPVGTAFLFLLLEWWKDKHGINWELSRTINYTQVKGEDRCNLPEINFPRERC